MLRLSKCERPGSYAEPGSRFARSPFNLLRTSGTAWFLRHTPGNPVPGV